MLHNQFVAVLNDTALVRTLPGYISAAYNHEVGPHVVAKDATKRYEQATMAMETARLSSTSQVMSSLLALRVSAVLGCP